MGFENFDEVVDSVMNPRDVYPEKREKLTDEGNDIDRSLQVMALSLDSDYSDCSDLQFEAYKYPDLSEDPDVNPELKSEYEFLRKDLLLLANRMKDRVGYLAGKVDYLQGLGGKGIMNSDQYRKDYDRFKLDFDSYKSGIGGNEIVSKGDFASLLQKKADIELMFSERLGLKFDGVSVRSIDQRFKFSDREYNQLSGIYGKGGWEQIRYYRPLEPTFKEFLTNQSLDFPENFRKIIPGDKYNADGGTNIASNSLLDAFNLDSFNYLLPKNLVIVLRVSREGNIDVQYCRINGQNVVQLRKNIVSTFVKQKDRSEVVANPKILTKARPKSGFRFTEKGVLRNGKLDIVDFDFIPDRDQLGG